VAEFLHLVQEGACVADTDAHGWSALHWASSKGSVPMTYVVLQEIQASQQAGDSPCLEMPYTTVRVSRVPFGIRLVLMRKILLVWSLDSYI